MFPGAIFDDESNGHMIGASLQLNFFKSTKTRFRWYTFDEIFIFQRTNTADRHGIRILRLACTYVLIERRQISPYKQTSAKVGVFFFRAVLEQNAERKTPKIKIQINYNKRK
jgi:hypothetical protein